MASDLSSECTEMIGALDEKEEGEISLEDVSSSEEGHLNYGYGARTSQCSNCLSSQHNAAWCTTAPAKFYPSKGSSRREVDLILQDAVQGKENRHQIKESGCIGTKHTASTLQEKNDDLVPISSDSDMEIVGLADNPKQIVIRSSGKSKTKKKRKKKRSHGAELTLQDLVSSSTVDTPKTECVNMVKHDTTKSASTSHHREASPIHRSNRSRVISRFPPRRQRSVIRTRSPFRRSKSPGARARSPTIRRSPRRLKSPKRSPYRSSTKAVPRKTSHLDMIQSHNYVDTHKLLKKVRQLDSIGTHSLEETLNKNKEHASSLKEKLSNMMKEVSDNNNDFTNSSKEKPSKHVDKVEPNDADDEEDLALLRQKALETKQNKSNKQNDQPKTETEKNVSENINDDQDEEDLELRMIALRSAVLKKHQNRVQKGMKSGKSKKSSAPRSESPFTQSFLDNIPIPGEELLNFASPPHTPVPVNENNHMEDMDIDTDVEREKEKLPYSPTDKITANIPMDTELLGIQPSDVSFINVNESNSSPNFSTSVTSSRDNQQPYQTKIIENRSYLPNIIYYSPLQNPLCATNTNMQYLETNSTESSKPNFMKVHNAHVNAHSYENTCNILKNSSTAEFVDTNSNQEMPYSPTDTPVYDPDLSHVLPQPLGPLTTSSSSLVSMESYAFNMQRSSEQYNHVSTAQHMETTAQIKDATRDNQSNKAETFSLDPVVGSTATSLMESVSPSSSMITIDDLFETDVDGSPFTEPLRGTKLLERFPNDLLNNSKGRTLEPLYMKGIPDVTKDTNKIPTLINRTLVPASILKTNKQLQLPLPNKKPAIQQQPTFKSAEMQPVVINEETNTKMNASFKPMKLLSFPQKSQSVLTIPIAFHDSLHEDSTNEMSLSKVHSLLTESNHHISLIQDNTPEESSDKVYDTKNPPQKKKKLMKKGVKRRNTVTTPVTVKKLNVTDTKDDSTNTIEKQVHELHPAIDTSDTQEIQRQVDEKSKVSLRTKQGEIQGNDTSEQKKGTEDRRESLDEDEEALRAILLASLPKRTKTTNSQTATIETVSTASTVTNQVVANQTTSKTTLSTTKTDTVTNADGMKLPSTPHVNSHGLENDKNQSNAGEKVNTATQGSPSVAGIKALNPITSGRKRSVSIAKGQQKKLMKRVSIPASTKVVNNAKRYQNTMIQRKLNLQRATLYNKQKMAENKAVSKVKSNDSKWSANVKLLPDTQRIVINLESDTESDSESERQRITVASSANSTTVEKYQSTINPTAEFEKNLDQFLRAVRKKQESMAAARPTSISQTSKKDTVLTTNLEKSNSSNLHTPLAVRHLPASQQEEYRRLKQQILEREKLKLHRTMENNVSLKNKNAEGSSKSALLNSPIRESHIKLNETMPPKSQSINAQQLNKENCSKNIVDTLKNTSTSTINVVQSSISKICNVGKQENTSPNQTKTISRSVTNHSIRVSTENNASNAGNKITGNSIHSSSTSRKVSETPTQKAQVKTKVSPGIKILSTDEVNRKYVQIQVKNDTNERVVTINDKVTLNNKSTINQNDNIIRSQDNNSKGMNDCIQSVEKDIKNNIPSDNNDEVDSNVSTIILTRGPHERGESVDTSDQSTIRLSQFHDSTSSSSNAATKDDDHSLLLKTNIPLKTARNIERDWKAIKKDVKTELNTLVNLPRVEQEQHLMETEQMLVMKRYTILDDLAEMSTNLRQWHMERDLQTDLVAEVKKLREQLKVAEERLQVQRNRINSIGPKVVEAHGKINAGRQECFKLATICSTLGSRIVGKDYKVPEAGAQLLDNRLKEVANHTRQLSRKKVPSIDIPEIYNSTKLEEESVSAVYTEISQSGDLLPEECNAHDVGTMILNENESLINLNESENVAKEKVTTVDQNELDKEKDVSCNDEESTLGRNDTEEVCSEQVDLNDASAPTTGISNPKDIQELDNKDVPGDNTVRPTTSEHESKKRSPAGSEEEHQKKQKKTLYESILTHFKVPRNTNPNGILCPYELMGTCNDGDCQFVHQTESQAK